MGRRFQFGHLVGVLRVITTDSGFRSYLTTCLTFGEIAITFGQLDFVVMAYAWHGVLRGICVSDMFD